MLPEILHCDTKCQVPMTLTKEALNSFDTMRPRSNRSTSRESSRSETSEISDSSSNDPELDEQLESHAYELHAQLEIASTFDLVSSLSFNHDTGKLTRSIFSFSENPSDNLHVSPKIRRSSTPCVSLSSNNNMPTQHSMPYLCEQTSETKRSTSQSTISKKTHKPRKRSWDSRLPSENTC